MSEASARYCKSKGLIPIGWLRVITEPSVVLHL